MRPRSRATALNVALGVVLGMALACAPIATLALAAGKKEVAQKPKVQLTTSLGTIVLQLDAKRAPKTVANFLRYVREGFYKGTIFHRVISNFMLQGGGFDTKRKKKKTHDPIQNEADNGLKNAVGTVAMARTGDPHSASAQFFINVKNNSFLNFRSKNQRGWGYTVFGKVIKGMDVVKKIKAVPVRNEGGPFANMPVTPVVITNARLL